MDFCCFAIFDPLKTQFLHFFAILIAVGAVLSAVLQLSLVEVSWYESNPTNDTHFAALEAIAALKWSNTEKKMGVFS